MATTPKIAMRDVKKAFGPKVVLDGVNLTVAPGESLVIIGGSGTGKSVTLKCILGLLAPDREPLTGSRRNLGPPIGERELDVGHPDADRLEQREVLVDHMARGHAGFFCIHPAGGRLPQQRRREPDHSSSPG